MTGTQPDITHVDGIDWFDAPLPPWRHKCWAQTTARARLETVKRCPCGAIAITRAGERDYWMQRNSTRWPVNIYGRSIGARPSWWQRLLGAQR